MAIKTLEDFNYDYQAYADYLESAECADDEDYDIYVDEKGNIYERTDKSWQIGHGHKKTDSDWEGRDKNDPESYGRDWKNPWLKYKEELIITKEELKLLKENQKELKLK